MNVILVAIGSALGGILRYGVAQVLGQATVATLVVNILGSFVIGYAAASPRLAGMGNTRLFVMVGLCGGFTTFSAFSFQTLDLLRSGAWGRAAANVAFSVLLCIAAVAFGSYLAGDSGTQAGI